MRAAALVLVLVLSGGARAADDVATQEAARLARASLDLREQADDLEQGWKPLYERGIALAEKAIAIDPGSAEAHYALFCNLGRKSERTSIAAQARNIGRLRELLKRTLELDPHHAHAWEAQGEMLMRLPWIMGGSEAKGEAALRRSAELDPKWSKPHLRLAELYWRRGEAESARAEAELARDLTRAAGDTRWLRETEALLAEISASLRP